MQNCSAAVIDVLEPVLSLIDQVACQYDVCMDVDSEAIFPRNDIRYRGSELMSAHHDFWDGGMIDPEAHYQDYEYNYRGRGLLADCRVVADLLSSAAFNSAFVVQGHRVPCADVEAEAIDLKEVDKEGNVLGVVDVFVYFLAEAN